MDTRWATVDGVHLELPVECTVGELRERFHKPRDATLIAVTGDLVSVVHDEEAALSELVAGCADTYYFTWADGPHRNEILDAPALDRALSDPDAKETTFQRPGIDR